MTREKANNIARGITDKIEAATTDIDDWAEFWGFTRDDYEEFLDVAIEALSAEPCEDCISREFIEIVVNYPPADLCCYPEYREKPYFSIKYRENGKYIVGYGSYKIEMISQWIKEYFMPSIQPKTDVLDKIRTEIIQMPTISFNANDIYKADVLAIIDKYKTESEGKE